MLIVVKTNFVEQDAKVEIRFDALSSQIQLFLQHFIVHPPPTVPENLKPRVITTSSPIQNFCIEHN